MKIFLSVVVCLLISAELFIPQVNAQDVSVLKNSGFENIQSDSPAGYDPTDWKVIEGYAIAGTGEVPPENEKKEYVQDVEAEGSISPAEGNRMLKVNNHKLFKSAIIQYYTSVINSGTLIQKLSVYPLTNNYLQQLEVRGRPDFPEVYGLQLYSLKFYGDKLRVCVRTGGPDAAHICGYDKNLARLPIKEWSTIETRLKKVNPTANGVSRWKLTMLLNGQKIFDSGNGGYPYVEYIKDLRHIFLGDECEQPNQECDGPDGTLYYDDISAIYQSAEPTTTVTASPTNAETKPGDANDDNEVDGVDYVVWLNHYNQNTNNGYRDADFNTDGKVDGLDYVIWVNNTN
ncbi:hypothetical protein HY345_02485 [Candidatus Microgenomates bacterium]|nr:hypothetical protein [Candidatus Microgenomates bacterium]